MKHVFVKRLPKDAEFIGSDILNRKHYEKGCYRYMVNDELDTIERFKI